MRQKRDAKDKIYALYTHHYLQDEAMKRIFIWMCCLWSGFLCAAPNVILPDAQGVDHRADEFIGQGRWMVVAIWSADCAICQREIPTLAFFHDEHKGKDADVVGVVIDTVAERERVRRFIDEQGLNFPNLIAAPRDVAHFGGGAFSGTPTYLLFSPKGELRFKHVGSLDAMALERRLKQLKAKETPSL